MTLLTLAIAVEDFLASRALRDGRSLTKAAHIRHDLNIFNPHFELLLLSSIWNW